MERTTKINDESKSSHKRATNTRTSSSDIENEKRTTQLMKVGLVTFKSQTPLKNIQTILKNKKQNLFYQKSWTFQSSKLSKLKETQFYSIVHQLSISQLEYKYTEFPQILKIVQHIDFNNLTKLCLLSSSITNIEPLGSLNVQNLKSLDLGGNLICQSKLLTKLSLLKLQYLEVSNNPLFELNIGRIQQQNSRVYPRVITIPSDIVFQDVSFLAKLEHNVVSQVMEFDLKYYSGQSMFGFSFNGYKDQKKLILQQKICRALKKKLVFQ